MHRPQDIEKVLRRYPIEDVWGVGRRYAKMLKANGVNTAWDFTQLGSVSKSVSGEVPSDSSDMQI